MNGQWLPTEARPKEERTQASRMANEELTQRNYLASGQLRGDAFGLFEELNIGATSVAELKSSGLDFAIAPAVTFPFTEYKRPKTFSACKPDRVLVDRRKGTPLPVAIAEHKGPRKMCHPKTSPRRASKGSSLRRSWAFGWRSQQMVRARTTWTWKRLSTRACCGSSPSPAT